MDLAHKTILLTGGTGSFGNAFVSRILRDHPTTTVRVYSRDELKQSEMATKFGHDPRLRFFVGDIRSRERLSRATKGVDFLIDACSQAGVPLVIVGDGPKRAELQARAAARGGRCEFLGHLKGAALWSHVEAASLVALPSVWYEIAPKSILEAQARSRPCLVTTIGGLPEMVEEGATGFLAAPSDLGSLTAALRRAFALGDDELAAMGERARQRATTTFTRDRYYREMTALYAELSPAIAAHVALEAQAA